MSCSFLVKCPLSKHIVLTIAVETTGGNWQGIALAGGNEFCMSTCNMTKRDNSTTANLKCNILSTLMYMYLPYIGWSQMFWYSPMIGLAV